MSIFKFSWSSLPSCSSPHFILLTVLKHFHKIHFLISGSFFVHLPVFSSFFFNFFPLLFTLVFISPLASFCVEWRAEEKSLIIVSTRVCWRTFPFNNGYTPLYPSLSSHFSLHSLSSSSAFHPASSYSIEWSIFRTYCQRTKLFLPCTAYLFPIFIVYFPNSTAAGMKNPFCMAESHCYYFYLSYWKAYQQLCE